MAPRILGLLLASTLLASGCGPAAGGGDADGGSDLDGGSTPDAGVPEPDAGPDAGFDAGTDPGVTGLVPANGGTVTLEDVATADFPAGAFAADQEVRIDKTHSAAAAAAFVDSASIFQPSAGLDGQVRIATGRAQPLTNVAATLTLPAELVVPQGSRVEAFVWMWEQDELDALDNFELFPSSISADGTTLTVTLPPTAFTAERGTTGDFEAVVTLAPTPGTLERVGFAAGGSFLPPLDVVTVRSAFNPGRVVTVNGVPYTGHWGVDFVADGAPIYTTWDGTVVKAYRSNSFGNTVVFDMQGLGIVRYAHLNEYNVSEGDRLLAGEEIGITDNTGLSTGPHLHFEYAPDGQFDANKSKVDPVPRIADRPLVWSLSSTAVYASESLVPGVVNDSRLELQAEAELLLENDDSGARVFTLTGGSLLASYSGQYDRGSGEICHYEYPATTFPLVLGQGSGLPAEGETVGGVGISREPSVPSLGYVGYGQYYTNATSSYDEVCLTAETTTHALSLAGMMWLYLDEEHFDPFSAEISGELVVDQGVPGVVAQTTTYTWTLTKGY